MVCRSSGTPHIPIPTTNIVWLSIFFTLSQMDLDNDMDLQASSADLGPPPDAKMDTEDREPDPAELEQKKRDDKDFLTGIVSNFLAKRDKWSMSNIAPAFNALAKEIAMREANRGELVNNTFVALELVPAVTFFIVAQLFRELSESCKLTRDKEEEFVLCLLSIMNPERHPRGLSVVQNFGDLLNPRWDGRWSRALGGDVELELREKAQQLLSLYVEGRQQYSPEESEKYDAAFFAVHPDFDAQRLYNIANEHFPCGFNTETEQRYVYFDLRYLLFPNEVDIKCAKTIPASANRYIQRSAGELFELELQRDDQEQSLMQHLTELTERGRPHDYTVEEPENPEEEGVF